MRCSVPDMLAIERLEEGGREETCLRLRKSSKYGLGHGDSTTWRLMSPRYLVDQSADLWTVC